MPAGRARTASRRGRVAPLGRSSDRLRPHREQRSIASISRAPRSTSSPGAAIRGRWNGSIRRVKDTSRERPDACLRSFRSDGESGRRASGSTIARTRPPPSAASAALRGCSLYRTARAPRGWCVRCPRSERHLPTGAAGRRPHLGLALGAGRLGGDAAACERVADVHYRISDCGLQEPIVDSEIADSNATNAEARYRRFSSGIIRDRVAQRREPRDRRETCCSRQEPERR